MSEIPDRGRKEAFRAGMWLAVFFLCETLFYYQGIRDILISRRVVQDILPILLALPLAPVAAVLIVYAAGGRVAMVLGAVLTVIGRLLLFSPVITHYHEAEVLIFAGFPLVFIGAISLASRRSDRAKRQSAAAAIGAGMMLAPAVHLVLRLLEATSSVTLGILFCLLLLVSMAGVFSKRRIIAAGESISADGAGTAPLMILLSIIPVHFLFVVFGKPEFLASRCSLSYGVTAAGVVTALALSALAAAKWGTVSEQWKNRYRGILLAGNVIAAIYFFSLYSLGEGTWQLGLVMLCAAVVGVDLYFILSRALARQSGLVVPAAAVTMILLPFATFGIDAGVLLENHLPSFHGWMMLPVLLAFAGAFSSREGVGFLKNFSTGVVFCLALALVFDLVFFFAPSIKPDPPDVGPKVFASLYTWYGTPGGTYGNTFPGVDFEKEGTSGDFDVISAPEGEIMSGQDSRGRYHVLSEPSTATGSLAIGFNFPPRLIESSVPTYISLAYGMDAVQTDLWLEITSGGATHRAPLPAHKKIAETRLEWPYGFEKTDAGPGPGCEEPCLRIIAGNNSGRPVELFVDYVRFSVWKHWNEDYRAYYDEEKEVYFNDPPHTLAAAHRVTYTGEPWPEIEPYSPEGYYDSLDDRVMRSQLELMEKAGIDVVLFMHPYSTDVIRQGMDIIREEGLDLEVSWYWTGDDENFLIEEMKELGADPLWALAGEEPVVVVGPTGMRELPHARYIQKLARITGAGIFAIGDSYSPPKEEMLDLLDGHYYYDTTGLYRARWGGRHIEAAKPDGTFVTGHGHLYTIFDAISRLTHAHGGVFLATVIPGFDNLAVHGFEGSPLYDGRPGTVVRRHDGETYAETWQAAIDSGADWICIVSWNELHEGTEIEPTMEDGVKYVELTREWAKKFRESRGL